MTLEIKVWKKGFAKVIDAEKYNFTLGKLKFMKKKSKWMMKYIKLIRDGSGVSSLMIYKSQSDADIHQPKKIVVVDANTEAKQMQPIDKEKFCLLVYNNSKESALMSCNLYGEAMEWLWYINEEVKNSKSVRSLPLPSIPRSAEREYREDTRYMVHKGEHVQSEMRDVSNMYYTENDDIYGGTNIYTVQIVENETANKLNLQGNYSLQLFDDGFRLLDKESEIIIFSWPVGVLRRYGSSNNRFSFETGRRRTNIYTVEIVENETANKLNLQGNYSLQLFDDGFQLLDKESETNIFSWPVGVLRRYGSSNNRFSFETGRRRTNIYTVEIVENETANKLNLQGNYSLQLFDDGFRLLDKESETNIFSWPVGVLRRYGSSNNRFSFETGRRSESGVGNFVFLTPFCKLINQAVFEMTKRVKESTSSTDLQRNDSVELGNSGPHERIQKLDSREKITNSPDLRYDDPHRRYYPSFESKSCSIEHKATAKTHSTSLSEPISESGQRLSYQSSYNRAPSPLSPQSNMYYKQQSELAGKIQRIDTLKSGNAHNFKDFHNVQIENDEFYGVTNLCAVEIVKNETAMRMNLHGDYNIQLFDYGFQLKDITANSVIFSWQIKELRRYTFTSNTFSFETGRLSESGVGNFLFSTPSCDRIKHALYEMNENLRKNKPIINSVEKSRAESSEGTEKEEFVKHTYKASAGLEKDIIASTGAGVNYPPHYFDNAISQDVIKPFSELSTEEPYGGIKYRPLIHLEGINYPLTQCPMMQRNNADNQNIVTSQRSEEEHQTSLSDSNNEPQLESIWHSNITEEVKNTKLAQSKSKEIRSPPLPPKPRSAERENREETRYMVHKGEHVQSEIREVSNMYDTENDDIYGVTFQASLRQNKSILNSVEKSRTESSEGIEKEEFVKHTFKASAGLEKDIIASTGAGVNYPPHYLDNAISQDVIKPFNELRMEEPYEGTFEGIQYRPLINLEGRNYPLCQIQHLTDTTPVNTDNQNIVTSQRSEEEHQTSWSDSNNEPQLESIQGGISLNDLPSNVRFSPDIFNDAMSDGEKQ